MLSRAPLPVHVLAEWLAHEASLAAALHPRRIRLSLRLLLAHWEASVVRVVEELALEVLLLIWRAGPEREAQELVRSPCLHVLLVEQVKKQILVSLNQSLRVYLTMLELFISISLDSLQESCQGHLLLSSQPRLLLLDDGFYLLFLAISFFLFFEVALHVELFGLFVALCVHQFLDLLPHVHELF